jgi:hypothetical protein
MKRGPGTGTGEHTERPTSADRAASPAETKAKALACFRRILQEEPPHHNSIIHSGGVLARHFLDFAVAKLVSTVHVNVEQNDGGLVEPPLEWRGVT